ncbi:MAG: ferritin-like domain-containing protein [Janthinobacterium lividum]
MGLFTPDFDNLRELYTTSLQRQLNSERQITVALEEMKAKATANQLAAAFSKHLDETKEHVSRLERILKESVGKVSDSKCKITSALISGAQDDISSAGDAQIRDVVLIASGNQVEHHEIAMYGTLRNWAMILGETKHAELLEKTLEEEKEADKMLTKLSEQINVAAPVS